MRAKSGAGHCGGKMKGKGLFKRLRRGIRNTARRVRRTAKKLTKIPVVKKLRRGIDTALKSRIGRFTPLGLAYGQADRGFRIANELSKGNFAEAGKAAVNMSGAPVKFHTGSGKQRGAKVSTRRVAASRSRIQAPVLVRRR